MPSTLLGDFSGGVFIVSGNILSGTPWDIGVGYPGAHGWMGGVQMRLDRAAPGPIGVGLPNPYVLSGISATFNSGGALSSGGLLDGMVIFPGEDYFVPKSRLASGLQSICVVMPAASSGGRLYWEWE